MKFKTEINNSVIIISALILLFFSGLNFGRQQAQVLPRLEQPLLISSAGQSPDVQLASVLAKRAGLVFELSKSASEKDLEMARSLAVVVGASMKGLGQAGLDVNREKERVRSLVAEAKKRGIPVLFLHLGGEARRGQLTDEFIVSFIPEASLVIVVKSGNADGLFTRICQEKNIPLIELNKASDLVTPLKEVFK